MVGLVKIETAAGTEAVRPDEVAFPVSFPQHAATMRSWQGLRFHCSQLCKVFCYAIAGTDVGDQVRLLAAAKVGQGVKMTVRRGWHSPVVLGIRCAMSSADVAHAHPPARS